ncbi:hypothetical protein HMPREF9318_00187 [Streptococcus urinalis FB127-CNA-2]|uniref:Putative hemin transport system permease protein HrtB n=1 Tax=Streptococcus urinalis 2285-97 TaxID=764291 RepID=G5KF22_9STRE|nr:ABC transporter permease [Streptococcus urinalis]EHJ56781.1 efflux ABC transporter, permease protein [Streptococcus urinalis 2285-97]EKS21989.1 hypothetical protein HMPREF9318_00187 [Streptococcus urinalis FB127-CNA-2]VEF31801.1 permease [Streptococcus urinalis]
MFLALNEMRHSKLRYSLIFGLLFLVAYLMFFLTGLAYGLMQENRSAVDKWEASSVLLTRDSNSTLTLSMFDESLIKKVDADKKAPLAQLSTVSWTKKDPKDSDKAKVSFFGIDKSSFLAPHIEKGRMFKSEHEAVIDKTLADEYDFKIGDKISSTNSSKTFKIVGYTSGAKFSVSPVIYTSLKGFESLKFNAMSKKPGSSINALVIKGKLKDYPKDDLQEFPIKTFINKLPGYNAQVMTFGFMIVFLIVISAIIIGIFMYVLTIQKAPIFGVMKAQGIANKTIASAVLMQTFILSALGSAIGLLGTWLTSLGLPSAVPFQSNWLYYGVIFVAMVGFALLGTLFSIIAIIKIDPLKSIG